MRHRLKRGPMRERDASGSSASSSSSSSSASGIRRSTKAARPLRAGSVRLTGVATADDHVELPTKGVLTTLFKYFDAALAQAMNTAGRSTAEGATQTLPTQFIQFTEQDVLQVVGYPPNQDELVLVIRAIQARYNVQTRLDLHGQHGRAMIIFDWREEDKEVLAELLRGSEKEAKEFK